MNMKKMVAVASVAALLGGCAYDSDSAFGGLGGGTGIGGSVVKMAVDHQCRSELNKRNEWRLVALECGQTARVGRQNLRLRERGSTESGVCTRVNGCFESFFARSGDCVGNGENRQCLFQAFV